MERENLFQFSPRTLAKEAYSSAEQRFLSSLAADAIAAGKLSESRFYEALLIPEVLEQEYQAHLAEVAKNDPDDPIHSAVKAMQIKYRKQAQNELESRYNHARKSDQSRLKGAVVNRLLGFLQKDREEKLHEDPSRVDPDYLGYLFDLRKQTLFLTDDIKSVTRPSNMHDELPASKVYAAASLKQNDTLPIQKLLAKPQIKKRLLGLVNINLNAD